MPRSKTSLAGLFRHLLAPVADAYRAETGRDLDPAAVVTAAKRTVRGWFAGLLRRAADWLAPVQVPEPVPAPVETPAPGAVPPGWDVVETHAPELLVEPKPEPAPVPTLPPVPEPLPVRVETPAPVKPARKPRKAPAPKVMAAAPRTTAPKRKPAKRTTRAATGRPAKGATGKADKPAKGTAAKRKPRAKNAA